MKWRKLRKKEMESILSPPSKDFVSKPPLRLKQTPSTLMRRGFCWNVDGSND